MTAGDPVVRYAALIGAVAITHAAWAAGEARVLDVRLNERVLPPSQRVLVAQEGEEVTIRWASNHPIRVRLQGYDLEASITHSRPDGDDDVLGLDPWPLQDHDTRWHHGGGGDTWPPASTASLSRVAIVRITERAAAAQRRAG